MFPMSDFLENFIVFIVAIGFANHTNEIQRTVTL